MNRKILVVTGTRAEYGILYPVMQAIVASRSLKLQLVVTGMHLMRDFGYTYNQIKKDGFNVYGKVNISYQADTKQEMLEAFGKTLICFSDVFSKACPDIILVMGDRGEMLAAAIAGNYLNIPVAHIHGGESSGHIDGVFRHAITKLAHIHFCATDKARETIIKLGEDPRNIFLTGAPALDRVNTEALPSCEYLQKKYSIDVRKPFLLVVQHPIITQINEAAKQMIATLEAIKSLRLQSIIIYPNADAGGREMIKIIKRYQSEPIFTVLKNVPHKDYLGLMRIAAALIGNSSSGIIEAPSFGLPVINIGIRQLDRQRSNNVIDVPHRKEAIRKAIKKCLDNSKFRERIKKTKSPYGDGQAAKRIVRVLSSINLHKNLLQKKLAYK